MVKRLRNTGLQTTQRSITEVIFILAVMTRNLTDALKMSILLLQQILKSSPKRINYELPSLLPHRRNVATLELSARGGQNGGWGI
jgi:hypothetical protein